jgi:hypothetical protein
MYISCFFCDISMSFRIATYPRRKCGPRPAAPSTISKWRSRIQFLVLASSCAPRTHLYPQAFSSLLLHKNLFLHLLLLDLRPPCSNFRQPLLFASITISGYSCSDTLNVKRCVMHMRDCYTLFADKSAALVFDWAINDLKAGNGIRQGYRMSRWMQY